LFPAVIVKKHPPIAAFSTMRLVNAHNIVRNDDLYSSIRAFSAPKQALAKSISSEPGADYAKTDSLALDNADSP
jgi:hypothetical protein